MADKYSEETKNRGFSPGFFLVKSKFPFNVPFVRKALFLYGHKKVTPSSVPGCTININSLFFRGGDSRRTQHPVVCQKSASFFYVFLPETTVVPKGKLCYNDRD